MVLEGVVGKGKDGFTIECGAMKCSVKDVFETYSPEYFLASIAKRPAFLAASPNGFVRMTNIFKMVSTMGVSYRQVMTRGSSFCCTTFHLLKRSEMGLKVSSSRLKARCKSCNQLRQSVTGTNSSPSVVVVPMTPHTSKSSSTTPRSAVIRLDRVSSDGVTMAFLNCGKAAAFPDGVERRASDIESAAGGEVLGTNYRIADRRSQRQFLPTSKGSGRCWSIEVVGGNHVKGPI
jgi:hypothetical protein